MKKLLLVSVILICLSSSGISQIPSDYPFKTFIDQENNLYVTGDSLGNVWTTKINSGGNPSWSTKFVNPGLDRGMDVAVFISGEIGAVYTTGYIKEPNSNVNDIILIKYDYSSGTILWTKTYNHPIYDDMAYGIAVDEYGNIYVAGYTYVKFKENNFLVQKYTDDGLGANLVWQYQYNNNRYNGDDVATDILLDRNYAYVSGYTFNGPFKNDILLATFSLADINNNTIDTGYVPNIYSSRRNLTPTGFALLPMEDNVHVFKSRAVISGVTDNSGFPGTKDYFTLFFNNDNLSSLRWANFFNGAANGNDVATAVAVDIFHNVYVTGYSYRNVFNQYDFATIKYTKDGTYGWRDSVEYFNAGMKGGNDKATSVKTRNDSIYVAGQSDFTGNGFTIKKYAQNQGSITVEWDREFAPSFNETFGPPMNYQSAAVLEIDSLGNVYLITYSWNDREALYAIRKYDANGNVLTTIDNYHDRFKTDGDNNPSLTETGENLDYNLSQNYPNPFNPSTVINYQIPRDARGETQNVKLIVYNSLGREVQVLVNEQKTAGSYKAEFNASNYPSGIYFYKLQTSSGFEAVKKMLLVK